MDLELQGKVALVTGSDRRTGQTIASTLSREGATVIHHGNWTLPEESLAVSGDVST
jgi:3-oxoacyl-[acyl-carrier protein] reductase